MRHVLPHGLVMPKTRMCERIFVRKLEDDTTVYKARCMLERNETSELIVRRTVTALYRVVPVRTGTYQYPSHAMMMYRFAQSCPGVQDSRCWLKVGSGHDDDDRYRDSPGPE